VSFAALGAVSATHTATDDPVDLDLTTGIAAGTTVVVPFGGDSSSVSSVAVTDSAGNTWDWAYRTAGQGNAGIAWCTLAEPLTSSNIIRLNFSSNNNCAARAYAFTGITDAELVEGTKGYTESSTFSLALSAASSGVQFCSFLFPYDYFSTTISGWTRFANIQDGSEQCLMAFYKEVSSGSQTCSKNIGSSIAYLAAGVRLPYGEATPPTTTTTTPPPGTASGVNMVQFF